VSSDSLTIIQPDDWHLHLRDGEMMQLVAPMTAKQFGRAIVMPNLRPPITTADQALKYRESILKATFDSEFLPLMTLYLTDNTEVEEIDKAKASSFIKAVKYYPAGATTNSDSGVTRIDNVYPVLERMQDLAIPLLLHGEVTDEHVDVFDREAVFIDRILIPLRQKFPELKMVLEHITTQQGVDYVLSQDKNLGATITPQHLLLNRNAIFKGGINPHHYCLPILKREIHREALVKAATSGDPRFFLGTDSAPHTQINKESACGCAGIFSAHAAIEFYALAFERAGALHQLEAFASFHGADFYGFSRHSKTITIKKEPWTIPSEINIGKAKIIPFMAGEELSWKIS